MVWHRAQLAGVPAPVTCPALSFWIHWRSLSGCTNTKKLTADKKVANQVLEDRGADPAHGTEGQSQHYNPQPLLPTQSYQQPLAL